MISWGNRQHNNPKNLISLDRIPNTTEYLGRNITDYIIDHATLIGSKAYISARAYFSYLYQSQHIWSTHKMKGYIYLSDRYGLSGKIG